MRKKQSLPEDQDSRPQTQEEESRPSSSGVMIFTLVFVLCLALFGGIGALWWFHGRAGELADTDPSGTSAVQTEPTERFRTADREAFAVMLTDNAGALQTVTLLMMQPDSHVVTAAAFPAELLLSEENGTLAGCFAESGADSAVQALSDFLGHEISYYGVMTYDGAEQALTALSVQLIYTLSEDVGGQSADGSFSIHLTSGEQALTSEQVSHLLQYTGWHGGRRARATAHAELFAAFCNQMLVRGRNGESDWALLQGSMETNAGESSFAAAEPALSYLAALNSGSVCTVLQTAGEYTGAGSTLRFSPDETMLSAIQSAMP